MLEEYKISQPVAYKIVNKILSLDKPSHAYLIETNGFDKGMNFAITFAKLLLCPHTYGKDCVSCRQCQMIDDHNFTELKIVEPDGSWIKKEQLLDLQEEFSKKAVIGKKKIYILSQAEKLNVNSSNSILKFLEDPQEGIIAILLTNNRYQLLDTILSRCQIISLNGQADIQNETSTISKIGQLLTHSDIEYQAFMEDGKNEEKIKSIVKFVNFYEKNRKKMILYMNTYWSSIFTDKQLMEQGFMILLHYYKDILNYKIGNSVEIFIDYIDNIQEIASKNTISRLTDKITIINQCRQNLEYNANLNLLMDKLIIQMEGDLND